MPLYQGNELKKPVAIVGSVFQAEVVQSEPSGQAGVVVWLMSGYADNPLRIDPTGTTVQPVSIQGGSAGNPAAGPTGQPVPSDADYMGFNSGGNLVGVSSSNPLPITVTNSPLTVNQGTSPWVTSDNHFTHNLNQDSSGNVGVNIENSPSVTITGSVAVTQSTSPWVTSDNHFTHNLNQDTSGNVGVNIENTPSITITGSVAVTQSTSPWVTQDLADMVGTVPGTAPSDTTIVGGIYNAASPTPSTGQTLPLQLDASGNLNVNVKVGGSGGGGSSSVINPGSYIQSAGGSFTGATAPTQTFSKAVTAGDTIFVAVSYTSTSTLNSITDNLGNSYIQVSTQTTAVNGLKFALYYSAAVFGGTLTVTANLSASSAGELIAVEYSGSCLLIVGSSANGTNSAPTTGNFFGAPQAYSQSLNVVFAYGQAGTLVPSNASSVIGQNFAPRFSTTNYIFSDCLLNVVTTPRAGFTQSSSSGFSICYGIMVVVNSSNVPMIDTSSFPSGNWHTAVMVAGSGGNGSPAGGVLSVQGPGTNGLLQISGNGTANGSSNPLFTEDQADGPVAAGTAASKSILGGGVLNTTKPALTTGQQVALQVDTTGSLYVNKEGRKSTFFWANNQNTFAASATDVLVLGGSSTKTVKLKRIVINGLATTVTTFLFVLVKRLTADTGGIALTGTPPLTNADSSDAVATATITQYSGNPTINDTTTNRFIAVWPQFLAPVTAAAGDAPVPREIRFGEGDEMITLRGTAQQLALSAGGTSLPSGANLFYEVEWTEE